MGSPARPWVALLAATADELEPLLELWGEGAAIDVVYRRWHVYRNLPGRSETEPDGNESAYGAPGAIAVESGYDKANAAQALTSLLERARLGALPAPAGPDWARGPRLVLQFGIAGAYPCAGLGGGDIVIATEEIYGDTGVLTPRGWFSSEHLGIPLVNVSGHPVWNRFVLDLALADGAADCLRRRATVAGAVEGWPERVEVGSCITVSCVTGTRERAAELERRWGAVAESMEGAAVAQVCLLYGLPLLEVRSISNLVGDRDRGAWDVRGAAARAARAAAYLATHSSDLLEPASGGSHNGTF